MAITDSIHKEIFTPSDTISITGKGRYLFTSGTYPDAIDINSSSDEGVLIEIEPGTTFSSTFTLSDNNITVLAGTCTDFQGIITYTGDNNSIICENGCSVNRITMSTSNKALFDGGGHDTLVSGDASGTLIQGGTDGIIRNLSINSKTSAGNRYNISGGTRCIYFNINLIDGDRSHFTMGSSNNKIINCFSQDIDVNCFEGSGSNFIVFANVLKAGSRIFNCNYTDSVVTNNYMNNDSIFGASSADNSICGNRMTQAITDSGTGNVINNNKVGA